MAVSVSAKCNSVHIGSLNLPVQPNAGPPNTAGQRDPGARLKSAATPTSVSKQANKFLKKKERNEQQGIGSAMSAGPHWASQVVFFLIRSWRSTGGFTTEQIQESVLSQPPTAGVSPVWHAPAAADASFSSGLVPTRLPLAARTQAVNSQDKS